MIAYIKYIFTMGFVTPWEYKNDLVFKDLVIYEAKKRAVQRKRKNRKDLQILTNKHLSKIEWIKNRWEQPHPITKGKTLLQLQAENLAFVEKNPQYFDSQYIETIKIFKFENVFNTYWSN
jgi:hypothetical protein